MAAAHQPFASPFASPVGANVNQDVSAGQPSQSDAQPMSPEAIARLKHRVALSSIVASVVITVAKAFAGFATGSLALMSDAAHSLADVAATTITWLAIRTADKPADEEHQYGHGKFESMAALLETAFLFILSGAVAVEGIRRLYAGESDVRPSWVAVAILVGAIVIDAWRWFTLSRIAKQTGSQALAADALHFSSDLVNSVLVLAALGAAAVGFAQADAIVALAVSVFIAVAGFRLVRSTVDSLLDTAPKGLTEQVRDCAANVPGVVGIERVRVRPAGPRVLGEVVLEVSRTLPLQRIAEIKNEVNAAIDRIVPQAEFTVTSTPVQLDDETVMERVMLTAARLRLPIHHVTVQNVGRRLSVSFDIEVDGGMSLGQAHAIASRAESAMRQELGPEVEVESHIEPLVPAELVGRESDAATVARIAATLAEVSRGRDLIHNVHHVRVRETPAGLVVNYHCGLDPELDVATMHDAVDALERQVRRAHPEIIRMVGHAEPEAQPDRMRPP